MTETPRSFAMSRILTVITLSVLHVCPSLKAERCQERAARRPGTRADARDPSARSTTADCNADCGPRGMRAPRDRLGGRVSDRRTVPQYQQLVQSRAGAPCATHGAP